MGQAESISRPNRRERIETEARLTVQPQIFASPGLTAGSGLKLQKDQQRLSQYIASPGLTAGSGLKLLNIFAQGVDFCISRPNRRERIETCVRELTVHKSFASPGLTAGSGLKHFFQLRGRAMKQRHLPA